MTKSKEKPTAPESDRLKLTGDWEKLIGEALKKQRPVAGWPEPPGRYGNKKTRQKTK